jgi:hypothetical protein
MRRKAAIVLLIMLVIATPLGIILRWKSGPSYSKNVRGSIQRAVLELDPVAESQVSVTIASANPSAKSQIEKELASCTMAALETRGDLFWKPYSYFRAKAPASIRQRMAQWREPRKVRRAAATWIVDRAALCLASPTDPGLNELATPVLCQLAINDRDPAVRRAATGALGAIGTASPEAFQIMLEALNHGKTADRRDALRWFGRNNLAAEKLVPVLVRGLEDDAMRSDYAEALRAYGPLAKSAVEPLTALAQTTDRATASVAYWALSGIDLEAAARIRVKQ